MKKPFERSYWVVPGKLLAGALPSDPDEQEKQRKISGLLEVGVRGIINLMEEHELDHELRQFSPYDRLFLDLGREQGLEVRFRRFPIRDMHCPSPQLMKKVLDEIDAMIEQGLCVYVHCWGGVGRTGTVVGCWLIRHGMTRGHDVFDLIARLRAQDPMGHRQSPETDEQRKMVLHWLSQEQRFS